MTAFLSASQLTYSPSPGAKKLLDRVDLFADRGEFVLLFGRNGSGKSTLFSALSGMIKAEGAIRLDGEDLSALSVDEIAKRVAILRQSPDQETLRDLTVLENLHVILGLPDREAALEGLSRFNPALKDHADQRVKYLSGGERQSLALALSVLAGPRVLLLDEFSSALDPKISRSLMGEVHRIAKSSGLTVLMATHDVEEALAFGDSAYVMHAGALIPLGPAKALTFEDVLRSYR